jgi:hypothetical protein
MTDVQSMTEAIHNATVGLEALQQGSIAEKELMELTNSISKLRGFLAAYATFNGTLSDEQEACLCRVLADQAREVGILLVKNCIMASTNAMAYRAKGDKEQEANSLAALTKIEKLAAKLALEETAHAKAQALETIRKPATNVAATNQWKSFFERWLFSEKQLHEIVPYIERL